MNSLLLSQHNLFSTVELDGTVLHSNLESDENVERQTPDKAGHNFYSEVAPFINVEDFQERLESFRRSREQEQRFEFNSDYTDGALPVRVLVARTTERSNGSSTKSLLVQIKKAE